MSEKMWWEKYNQLHRIRQPVPYLVMELDNQLFNLITFNLSPSKIIISRVYIYRTGRPDTLQLNLANLSI